MKWNKTGAEDIGIRGAFVSGVVSGLTVYVDVGVEVHVHEKVSVRDAIHQVMRVEVQGAVKALFLDVAITTIG